MCFWHDFYTIRVKYIAIIIQLLGKVANLPKTKETPFFTSNSPVHAY